MQQNLYHYAIINIYFSKPKKFYSMNILFLDFDGPLFPTRVFALDENLPSKSQSICKKLEIHDFINYWKMDHIAVNMLNNIYDITNYQIVVSSSWAELNTLEAIQNLFEENQIKAPIHKNWMTPRDKIYLNRAAQIAAWLSTNNCKNYLILDDVASGTGLFDQDDILEAGINQQSIFLVNEDNGIDWYTYQNIIQFIKKW